MDAELSEQERKALGNRIRRAAEAAHGRAYGSGSWLAKEVGVTRQTAVKWIRGDVVPAKSKMPQLARVLGVTESWLAGEETGELDRSLSIAEASRLAAKSMTLVLEVLSSSRHDVSKEAREAILTDTFQRLARGEDTRVVFGEVARAVYTSSDFS